jgi:hypothetical protein
MVLRFQPLETKEWNQGHSVLPVDREADLPGMGAAPRGSGFMEAKPSLEGGHGATIHAPGC